MTNREPIRYQHIKRGTTYHVLHDATMQAEGPLDNERVIVYQCEQTGRVWVRPYSEFMDGRFRVLPLRPTCNCGAMFPMDVHASNCAVNAHFANTAEELKGAQDE